MKKILTWGGIAFLVFFIAYRPNEAGGVVKTIFGAIGEIGSGFATFLSNLVSLPPTGVASSLQFSAPHM